jgi:hypothetical protein
VLWAAVFFKLKNIIKMNYESWKTQRNPLGNLYNVVRKSDGKEMLRGADYNKVYCFIGDDKHLYEIYFY